MVICWFSRTEIFLSCPRLQIWCVIRQGSFWQWFHHAECLRQTNVQGYVGFHLSGQFHPPIHLSNYPSIHPSMDLSANPSVMPSAFPFLCALCLYHISVHGSLFILFRVQRKRNCQLVPGASCDGSLARSLFLQYLPRFLSLWAVSPLLCQTKSNRLLIS